MGECIDKPIKVIRRIEMRIAIYSNTLDNGGISKFVYNLQNAFNKSNIRSHIVTFSADTIYGDDITLLFRKFASDFAEKYRMPAIQLTEDAKVLLLAYSWPGNVRQLKNITEQISIIETNRDITAEILRNYLPEQHVNSGLPALFGVKANTGKAFESEREILYQVLFDMRRDVTDLKKLVNTLMAERGAQSVPTAPATTAVSYYQEPQRNLVATVVPATPTIISAAKPAHPVVDDIQDTEEVVEEATLSLDEVEKEMIRKALDRHHGKRKNAAKDLNISERTLYRKIKEYGLD